MVSTYSCQKKQKRIGELNTQFAINWDDLLKGVIEFYESYENIPESVRKFIYLLKEYLKYYILKTINSFKPWQYN